MAKHNFIQDAIKRPGAFRKKAKAAGLTTLAFARRVLANKDKYDARTVRQAVLALRFMRGDLSKGKKKKSARHMPPEPPK